MPIKTDRICPGCKKLTPMTIIQNLCTECGIKQGRKNNKKYYKKNRLRESPKKSTYDYEDYGILR